MANVEPEQFRFKVYKKTLGFERMLDDFGSSSLEACCLNDLIIGSSPTRRLQCYELRNLDNVETAFDANCKVDSLLPQDLPLPRMDTSHVVIFLSISCDDEFMIVVHSRKPEYFLSCYALDGLNYLCTISCGKEFPKCMKFNPLLNNSFAMSMSNGNVQVCQIEKRNIGRLMEKQFEATALCWSPKGKQILVGTSSGQIVQITPQGDIKRKVKSSQLPGSCIHEIVWISTYHFICAFSQDPDVIFYSVSLQKDVNQPPTVEEIPDVLLSAMNVPDTAKMKVFMKYIPDWKIVICASSKSSDIGVIANIGGNDKWVVFMLDENARAQLPIPKGSNQDSLCVGLCVNFCSSRKVPKYKTESGESQEWPVLLAKSQFGPVYAYSIIYEGFSGNQKLCVKPKGFQNLSLQSSNALNSSDSSQPTRNASAKMQKSPFNVDHREPQIINTTRGGGNNASAVQLHLHEPAKVPMSNSNTGNLGVKTAPHVPAKSKAEIIKSTENLLRLFEEDLKIVVDNSTKKTISNDRSLAELQQRTTEMLKFKTELRTQLESLARDVQMLKNANLHTFNIVNRSKSVHERNNDERYQSFLKSAPLAPDLQKLSESIQTSKAFIELRSREILALIDNLNWQQKKQTSEESEYYEKLNAILHNNYRTIMAMGLKIDGLVAKYDGKIDAMSNMRKNVPHKSGLNSSVFPKVSGISLLDLNSSLKDLNLTGKVKGDVLIDQNRNDMDLPSDRINEIKDFLSRRTKVPMNKVPEIVSMKSQPTSSRDANEKSNLNLNRNVGKTDIGVSSEDAGANSVSSQREARAKMLENLRESVYLSQQPPSDKDAPVVNVKDLNMVQNMNPVRANTARSVPMPTFSNTGLGLDPKSSQTNISNIFRNELDSQKTDVSASREPPKYTPPTDLQQPMSGVPVNPILNREPQKSAALAFLQKSSNSASFFGTAAQTMKPGNENSPVIGALSNSSVSNVNNNQQNRVSGVPNTACSSASGIDLLLPSNSIVSAPNVSLNRSNMLPNLQTGNQSAFSTISAGGAHVEQSHISNSLQNTGNLIPAAKIVTTISSTGTTSVLPKNETLKSMNSADIKSNVLFPNQSFVDKGPQFVETQDLKDSSLLTTPSCQQNAISRTSVFAASSTNERAQVSSNQAFNSSNNIAQFESTHLVSANIFGKNAASTSSLDKSGSAVSNPGLSNATTSNEQSAPSVFGYGPIPKPPEKSSLIGSQNTLPSKDSNPGSNTVVGGTSLFAAPGTVKDNNSSSLFVSASKETLGANSSSALGFDSAPKTSTSVFDKSSSSLFQSPSSATIASLLGQKIVVATGQAPEKTNQQQTSTNMPMTSSVPNLQVFPNSTAVSQSQSTATVGGPAKPGELPSTAPSQLNFNSSSLSSVTSTDAKVEQKPASGSDALLSNIAANEASLLPKPTTFNTASNVATVTSKADITSQNQTSNPSAFPIIGVSSSTPSNGGLFSNKDEPKPSSIFGVTASASFTSSSVSTSLTSVATSQPVTPFGQLPATSNQLSSPFGNQNTGSSIFGQAQQKPGNTSSGWLNNGQQNTSSPFGQMTSNNTVPKNIFGQIGSSPFGASGTDQHSSPFGQSAQVSNASADTSANILGANAFSGLGTPQPSVNSTSNPFGSPFGGGIGNNLASSPFGQNAIASTAPQIQSNSVFGSASNLPFGQNIGNTNTPTTIFGKQLGGGSVFGASGSSQGSVFGQSATNAAFGATPAAAPVFGKTPAPAFGQAAAFGSGMPAFGGGPVFGSPSSSVFGKNAASPSGVFGSQSTTNNMQSFGGLVGGSLNNQTPAFGGNSSISSPFGATGSAFGGPMSGGTATPFGASGASMGGNSFSSWRS